VAEVTAPPFSPAAAADAARDGLALVRAQLDGDDDAAAMVAENMSWPGLTAGLLAEWFAELMRVTGMPRSALDEWQEASGLSRD
jgi:hypothetical protein